MEERYDAIVIGLGPGGEEVAGRLASEGLRVLGIEERLVGGECPYFACVPTKMMVRGAGLLAEARRVPGIAGEADVRPDWTPVAARIRDEATDNWDDTVAVERLEKKGARFVRGSGTFVSSDTVAVGDRSFTATRAVVVATGTAPAIPPIDGLGDVAYWTNRDAVKAERVPESLVVLGGGPVGLEMAQVFSRFGARVVVVEAGQRIMAVEDPESSELITTVFQREGIDVRVNAAARRVVQRDGAITVELGDGSSVSAERLLVAAGRRNNLAALQLGNAGLDDKARALTVDERMRAAPGIWAIGDITGVGAFTHLSMYQANIAVNDIMGRDGPAADYRALPRVTFTDPEVGSVGLNEQQARDRGLRLRTGIAQIPVTARGWIHKAGNDGFIKLIEDADRGVLVGATSAGPAGGEVLSMLIVAIHAEVPVAKLRTMITAYPTFHRGLEDALRDLGSQGE